MTLSGLRLQLCDLLGTEVDLSSASAMKEPVRANADREAVHVSRGPEMHLRDMLKAILLIEQFIEGMDFQAYLADLKTQAAVERELQIVTEAAYHLNPKTNISAPAPTGARSAVWETSSATTTTGSKTRLSGIRRKSTFLRLSWQSPKPWPPTSPPHLDSGGAVAYPSGCPIRDTHLVTDG